MKKILITRLHSLNIPWNKPLVVCHHVNQPIYSSPYYHAIPMEIYSKKIIYKVTQVGLS